MKFDRAPAGLALYMDGVKRAEIKEGSEEVGKGNGGAFTGVDIHNLQGKSHQLLSFQYLDDLDLLDCCYDICIRTKLLLILL